MRRPKEAVIQSLKSVLFPHLPYLALMVIVHSILYNDYWTGYRIISGRDFLFLEVTSTNFQADCLRGGSFALWNPFINFGFPWVEHYLNMGFSFTHLLTALLFGSDLLIVQRQLLFWILTGGIGIYLCAYELGSSRVSAMISGICFMFCGQIFMLPTGNFMIFNACAFPFLIYGYLRARKKDAPLSLVSVFFLTQYLLGGYMATGVLGLYLLTVYVFIDSFREKKVAFAVKHLAVTFVISILIALPKLLPMYLGMKSGPRLSGETMVSVPDPYNFLSSYDLLSLLIPVKYFFSVYVGLLSVVVIVYALISKRLKIDALLMLAVLSGWLLIADAGGNLSVLRKASYYLPMLKLVRVEWLHWYFPSIFALLYCSQYFDNFLNATDKGRRVAAVLVFIIIVSAVFFSLYAYSLHFKAYVITISLAVCWLLLALFMRPDSRPVIFAVIASILLAVEFGALLDRIDINVPAVYGEDFIEVQASDQWFASHSFRDDNLVTKIKPIRFLRDEMRPSVNDSRKWPYLVSAIDAQSQENLIVDLLNQKRFAGWFNNVQAKYEFIQMFESPDLAVLDNQPLYGLYAGATGVQSGAASLTKVDCSSFSFNTESADPSFLLLRQMFDDRWTASVDGVNSAPRKADKYFMGVEVGPGRHEVVFSFKDRIVVISLIISGLTMVGLAAYLVASRKKQFV